jgi:hypothetical protein
MQPCKAIKNRLPGGPETTRGDKGNQEEAINSHFSYFQTFSK